MSKESEIAAMEYLAKVNPKKYKLQTYYTCFGLKYLHLEEWRRRKRSARTLSLWKCEVLHSVQIDG